MEKRFLGIDYGEKRVGIAISDKESKIAFPFKILENNTELLDSIHSICGEQDIKEIVIGESLSLSGKRNKIMEEIDRFRQKLIALHLPIHFEKEFFTSFEVRNRPGKEKNNARKIKRDESKQKVDAKAASLILQRFLDKINQK